VGFTASVVLRDSRVLRCVFLNHQVCIGIGVNGSCWFGKGQMKSLSEYEIRLVFDS